MKRTLTLLWCVALVTQTAFSLPKLSSLPSAPATIFLDFDGHYVSSTVWRGGQPIDCLPAPLSDVQITTIFNRVSEDYRPFNVNITTDSTVFLAAPLKQRIRMIVTPTSAWYPGVGGVAYVGSFTWGDDTPGFIFTDKLANKPKYIAECCSHESGHTLGLSHQSSYNTTCGLVATYNEGIGSGEIGWAPIMGNSYYKNLTSWNDGPTPNGCNAKQDNLSIITSRNGFSYRPDDHADEAGATATPMVFNNETYTGSAIITTPNDKDAFKLSLSKTSVINMKAIPYSVNPAKDDGANIDLKVSLLNSAKQTIQVYDPSASLEAIVDTTLEKGTYYLIVDGTGNTNTPEYGSIGSYSLEAMYAPLSITPIKQVALKGKSENGKHSLNWEIISDEVIDSIEIESSADGRNFNNIADVPVESTIYSTSAIGHSAIFYRLKVISSIGEIAYSNILILKPGEAIKKQFIVSTLVKNNITVNATDSYQYQLADMSGRLVLKGNQPAGVSTINIDGHPNGIYFIQIINQQSRLTERIIKQ